MNSVGQATTETIFTLPFYLLIAFYGLQVCQLGVATVVTHYASSSISRKLSQDPQASVSNSYALIHNFDPSFKQLLVAGMEFESLEVDTNRDDVLAASGVSAATVSASPVASIKVIAISKVRAFPFLGEFMRAVLKSNVGKDKLFGPFSFGPGGNGYYFYITGVSYARLNYVY